MGRSALMGATFLCSSAGTVAAQMEIKVSGNTLDLALQGHDPSRRTVDRGAEA